MIAIGVMSGTSCDGVDTVALELESVRRPHEPKVLEHRYRAYPRSLQAALLGIGKLGAAEIARLHFQLGHFYADSVSALPSHRSAACIGLHGQTIWHEPKARLANTLQIGSSAVVAQRTGIATVSDLRSADVAIGGQGAPIVPFAHWFFGAARHGARVVVNFGGICNFTFVTRDLNDVVAYDVGPAMMLSDAFARYTSGGRLSYDRDGMLGRGGKAIPKLLGKLLAHPFVRRKPPKSTGREDFGEEYFHRLLPSLRRAPPADVAFTLLLATARILKRTLDDDRKVDGKYRELVLTGGGARNPALVAAVRDEFPGLEVRVPHAGVFAPNVHEPAAMALIGARTLHGLPSSLPGVTGASRAAVLGHIHRSLPPAPRSKARRTAARRA